MPRYGPISSELVAKIRERYLAGDKIETIEFDLDVSQTTIEKTTCDLPRRRLRDEKLRLQILELASLGCYREQIVRLVSCPMRTVHYALLRSSNPQVSEEIASWAKAAIEAENARTKAARDARWVAILESRLRPESSDS